MGAFDPNFISMFRDRFGGPDQQPQQGLPPEVAAYAQQRAMPLPPAGASEDELRNAHNRDLLVNVLGHGQGTNEAYLNQVQQARQADYARQKALVEADPSSRISRLQAQYRAMLDPRAKPLLDGMSATEIGQVFPGAKDAAESSDKRYGVDSENTRAGNTLGGENARAANSLAEERRHHLAEEEAARLKAEHEKKAADAKLRPYLGEGFTATQPLNDKQTEDFATHLSSSAPFLHTLTEYEKELEATEKTGRLTGEAAGRLNALHGQAVAEYMKAHGFQRLSEPDLKLFEDMFPKSTGAKGAFTRDSTVHGAIQALRSGTGGAILGHAKMLGIQASPEIRKQLAGDDGGGGGETAAKPAAPLPPVPAGKMRVRDQKTGATAIAPKASAAAPGWEIVS
jgi:hypothetical protein